MEVWYNLCNGEGSYKRDWAEYEANKNRFEIEINGKIEVVEIADSN